MHVDYLIIFGKLKPERLALLSTVSEDYKTRWFQRRWKWPDKATIYFVPNGNSFGPEWFSIQIENWFLYTPTWRKEVQQWLDDNTFSYHVTRMDIANDVGGQPPSEKYPRGRSLVHRLLSISPVYTRLGRFTKYYDVDNVTYTGCSAGMGSNGLHVRVYDKTLELSQNPAAKPYISSLHEKLKLVQPVTRIEAQFTRAYLENYTSFDDNRRLEESIGAAVVLWKRIFQDTFRFCSERDLRHPAKSPILAEWKHIINDASMIEGLREFLDYREKSSTLIVDDLGKRILTYCARTGSDESAVVQGIIEYLKKQIEKWPADGRRPRLPAESRARYNIIPKG